MSDEILLLERQEYPLIHVLLTTGKRIDFQPNQNSKVSDIISMIQNDETIKKPKNRTICLIYRGRILDKDEQITKIETLDEFTLHAFFRGNQQKIRQEPMEPELKGFDRLSRMNYSREEIAEIRNNFHRLQGTMNATNEERMSAEEEWFPVIFNHENPLEDIQLQISRMNRHVLINGMDQNREDEGYCYVSQVLKFVFGFMAGTMFGIGAILFILIQMICLYF